MTGFQLQWGRGPFCTHSAVSTLDPPLRIQPGDAGKVQLSSEKKMLKEGAVKWQDKFRSEAADPHVTSVHPKSTLPSALRPQGGSYKPELADGFLGWNRELHTGSKAHFPAAVYFTIYQFIAKNYTVPSSFIGTSTTGLFQ